MSGTLYFGDNLDVLREHVRDETVDLIYLDPPFNSAASYNVLFKAPDGKGSQSQITAFEDTWHWCDASEVAFDEVLRSGRTDVANMLRAFRQLLQESDMMAYITIMAVRITELHRVLNKDGAIYLHCDPTASHYIKILLDAVFGRENFRSEIVWRRSGSHNSVTRQFGPVHDCILFYSKSKKHTLRDVRTSYTKNYIEGEFKFRDTRGLYRLNEIMGPQPRAGASGTAWRGYNPSLRGRHWAIPDSLKQLLPDQGRKLTLHQQLDHLYDIGEIYLSKHGRQKYKQRPNDGVSLQDIWSFQPGTEGVLWESDKAIDVDVKWLTNEDEKLGYPTQKPVGLLQRIIESSSNRDALILDPFCGCGTSVHAAEKLGRHWLGIDITPLAINLISRRLKEAFGGISFDVRGIPRDLDGARELAFRDKHLFQLWACNLVDAQPYRDGKKSADGGVDGMIYFKPDGKITKAAIVSVKGGGNVGVAQVRDLRGTIERLGEPMGVFVTLTPPTAPMEKEAASAGLYDTGFARVPRIQIMTIERLLAGHKAEIPFGHTISYKRASREKATGSQIGLEF